MAISKYVTVIIVGGVSGTLVDLVDHISDTWLAGVRVHILPLSSQC